MPKILLLEDEEKLSFVLNEELQRKGFEVAMARDGQQGLELLKQETFDLVLLDIIMPVMDGITFLKQLRANEATSQLPVMILSNLRSGDAVEESKNLGVVDYIIKSDWKVKDILETVQNFLNGDTTKSVPDNQPADSAA